MNAPDSMLVAAAARFLADRVTPALLDAADAARQADRLSGASAAQSPNDRADIWAHYWADCEALGLDRVAVPAGDGGAGGGWQDLGAALRVAGASLAPGPLVEAQAGRAVLAVLGVAQPAGMVTVAPTAPGRAGAAEGELQEVPWGRAADWVLVERARARAAVAGLWLLPARGMSWTPGTNLAGEPRDSTPWPDAAPGPVAQLPAGSLQRIGALARATQIAGAGRRVLALACGHVTTREQFGRPLADFQVIQHQLARTAEAVAAIEAVTQAAWQAMVRGVPLTPRGAATAELLVAAAKVAAADRVDDIAGSAHQLHGAMGFTAEYELQRATRRLYSWRAEFGTAAEWAARLGARALARGGTRLWQDITAAGDE